MLGQEVNQILYCMWLSLPSLNEQDVTLNPLRYLNELPLIDPMGVLYDITFQCLPKDPFKNYDFYGLGVDDIPKNERSQGL